MQCPRCQAHVRLADVSKPCRCGAKLHLNDKWRALRALVCAALVMAIFYRWYPLEGFLSSHILWCVAVFAVWFALFFGSYFLVPFKLALTPQDGPVRLTL